MNLKGAALGPDLYAADLDSDLSLPCKSLTANTLKKTVEYSGSV